MPRRLLQPLPHVGPQACRPRRVCLSLGPTWATSLRPPPRVRAKACRAAAPGVGRVVASCSVSVRRRSYLRAAPSLTRRRRQPRSTAQLDGESRLPLRRRPAAVLCTFPYQLRRWRQQPGRGLRPPWPSRETEGSRVLADLLECGTSRDISTQLQNVSNC